VPASPESVVQRQLDAYNARDLAGFVAAYAEGVQVFRLPASAPALVGREALARYYAAHRFNRPALHATLLDRIVHGNKVIDHERVAGVKDAPFDALAVYEVRDGLIQTVWFFDPE
jgi:hypothetical protein